MIILLHSSKTMRPTPASEEMPYQRPLLLDHARTLATTLNRISDSELQTAMKLSPSMTTKTRQLITHWTDLPESGRPAIDAFLGDIYSGLQVGSFDSNDREFANSHLFILSGLYGVLRALDTIHPYRLEMGYRFASTSLGSLYDFWDDAIAAQLPPNSAVVNLSAVEYTKAVFPHLAHDTQIISPKFLTRHSTTGTPTFVTVHAKIARGAFAHWLITHRITDVVSVTDFNKLGYRFDPALSSTEVPVFVCNEFKGIGMSVRLN